ncbi:helix-turn-helix transcriptional regulator [Mangrovibacterium diazotrophicum]|uniref:DNA-binding XRE family transcriptional regulator n=1 Tax=Mangrovibacterium diazotrophicum TaxID=1261403 RepID=A0A419WAM5_9BACT|nr:helix-turn-helix transcriptional regulator [Mangrovibacterium diazotrophicum]RKD92525.1 DNA-binding XRE family transcriptional regulator [Mangrovibacterium diazotrophicum]
MTEQELELFYSQLSNKIVELRSNLNLTQQVFADELNISRASIVNIEKKRQRPTIHLLYKISVLAQVEMNYFFDSFNNQNLMDGKISDKIDKKKLNEDEKLMLKNYITKQFISKK